MKRVLALSIILAAIAVACSKNKFETVPTVEIKSLSPDVVGLPPADQLDAISPVTLRTRVTDKEGDVKDTVLIIKKYFLLDGSLESTDTLLYKLDVLKFPDTRDIEIQVRFTYGRQAEGYEFLNTVQDDRNFALGVIVVDNGGNRSTYVESGKILLKKP